jgi:tetratricopeptide (TPR) repeat protein
MPTTVDETSIARRRLILRDSVAILSLTLGTVVLFAITLFLFRSFSAHRADLGQRWSARGVEALGAGKPAEAIVALRTALTYAPGTPKYEQLLAQALGEAGHTDESTQYFMGLWDAEPGNGFINLQLARLAARRNDRPAAVNFYRASIYGTWEGDGAARRPEVRLELARYLLANRDFPSARMELLIAGGNAPDDFARDMAIGQLLEQAQDPEDAWIYYQHAAAARPGDPSALDAAGRLAYHSGDYEKAHRLLERAHAEREQKHEAIEPNADEVTMADSAARILELLPSPTLPARVRVARILAAQEIAKKRLAACSAQFSTSSLPSALTALNTRWTAPDGGASGAARLDAKNTAKTAAKTTAKTTATALLSDPAEQESAMQLVYDTEIQTSKSCGTPTGDDALLLHLATSPASIQLPETTASPQALVQHD